MRREPCKAWGHLFPADRAALRAVNGALASWGLPPAADLDGAGVLNIAFEGAVFPLDEIIDALRPWLNAASSGKIDLCDMENWTLTRASFTGTDVRLSTADLNNVLAYSGH